jgi:serine/threonine-protein kinase
VIGTALYMSPEQATGGELDGRADVYSAAVTLYRALTCKSPFAATSASELLAAVTSGAVIPLAAQRPDIDQALAQIVARGMAADKSQRFQSATEMSAALEHWLAVQMQAPPPSLAAPSHYPPAPHSTQFQSPTSLVPAPRSMTPTPVAAPRRRSKLPLVVGLLAVVGVLGVALAAAGFFAYQVGAFDSEVKVDFADAGAARASPAETVATSSEPSASPAPAGATEKGKAGRAKATDAGGQAAPQPSAEPAAEPAAAPSASPGAAKGALGAPCGSEADCTGNRTCKNGTCSCQDGHKQCGADCAPLLIDPYHCGKCDNQCGEKEICSFGKCRDCAAVPGRGLCNGRCVFLASDFNNCGMCGNKCPVGVLCFTGKCQTK